MLYIFVLKNIVHALPHCYVKYDLMYSVRFELKKL